MAGKGKTIVATIHQPSSQVLLLVTVFMISKNYTFAKKRKGLIMYILGLCNVWSCTIDGRRKSGISWRDRRSSKFFRQVSSSFESKVADHELVIKHLLYNKLHNFLFQAGLSMPDEFQPGRSLCSRLGCCTRKRRFLQESGNNSNSVEIYIEPLNFFSKDII